MLKPTQTTTQFILANIRAVCAAASIGTAATGIVHGGEPMLKDTKNVVEETPANPLCFADGTLCFDVQERMRFEIRSDNFDFNSGTNSPTDGDWLLQRFRIGLLWKPEPWLKFYVQGQDSREIGSDRSKTPGTMGSEGDDTFDLRQAYIEVGGTKDMPLSLKLGRQTLIYGDERLVGSFDWNNFGRTFDAAKVVYKNPKFQLDLFTSSVVVIERDRFNQSDLFNGNENHRGMIFSGVYLTTDQMPFGTADLYGFWLSQSSGNVSNQEASVSFKPLTGDTLAAQHSSFGTIGSRLKGDPKKLHGWEFELEGAYQNGQVNDLNLNAWAIHGGVGYNFDAPWKPRLWAEYNYASGDRNPNDGNSETFQNLFPTNHKFYGFMDVFSWQNMHNPMISLRVTPLKTVTAQLDYHAFWLASTDDFWYRANGLATVRPLTPAARAASNFAGQEIDFTVTWTPYKWLQFQAGYSHFFAGDYLRDTGTQDDADFGYLIATVNF